MEYIRRINFILLIFLNMKRKIIMISIDASTESTGVAIWENGKLSTTTLLNYSDIKNSDIRIETMCKNLILLLDKYKPCVVYIEDNYVGRNPKTQKQLCRIQGAVFGWCILRDSYFETMTPSSWRKYIPEFNKNKKRDIAKEFSKQYVLKNYNLDCIDDISDAILIGEAMLKKYE